MRQTRISKLGIASANRVDLKHGNGCSISVYGSDFFLPLQCGGCSPSFIIYNVVSTLSSGRWRITRKSQELADGDT